MKTYSFHHEFSEAREKEIIEILENAIDEDPYNENNFLVLGLYKIIGVKTSDLKKEGLDDYEHALSLNPTNKTAIFFYGLAKTVALGKNGTRYSQENGVEELAGLFRQRAHSHFESGDFKRGLEYALGIIATKGFLDNESGSTLRRMRQRSPVNIGMQHWNDAPAFEEI